MTAIKNRATFYTSLGREKGTTFLAADGVTSKDLFMPPLAGARLEVVSIVSSSTIQRTLFLELNDTVAGQFYPLGHVTIPAAAGTDGSVASVSGLNRGNLPWLQIDANGNPYLNLSSNVRLSGKLMSALTGSEYIKVTALGGDYTAVPTS